jgi:uncharacterized ferredoxin-like protein
MMSLIKEDVACLEALRETARRMVLAARTAPKGRGADNLALAIVEGETIQKIASYLKAAGVKEGLPGFVRDGENILLAPVMVLMGTRIQSMRLKKCGMCGFPNCDERDKHPEHPCVFNTGDLGIAVGSAVSVAMDDRVDNRIMYSVGQAVMEMKLLGDGICVAYGIPLSATSKNPFFDRKSV